MLIDKALQEFKEKYDRVAIESVVEMTKDMSLYKTCFDGFNITEATDTFIQYVTGFTQYRLTETGNPDAKPNNIILDHTKLMIKSESGNKWISDKKILISEADKFITEYVSSIDKLLKCVNDNQSSILESMDDNDSSSTILEMVDVFTEDLSNRVYTVMEHFLQMNGYHYNKRISEMIEGTKREVKPVAYII